MRLLLGDQRGNGGILVFQNTTLRKPADDSIGGSLGPVQLFLAKLGKVCGVNGLVLPENQTEPVFAFKDLGGIDG